MYDIKIAFGQRLKYFRKSKKISQEQLAELCELHPTYIGQLERGEKNASLETIMKLSIGLGVSPKDFFENITLDKANDTALDIYNMCIKLSPKKQEIVYKIMLLISDI